MNSELKITVILNDKVLKLMTKQENTVKNLENLYTVVIGLALTQAIILLIDSSNEGFPINFTYLPYFIAYLVTLVPFYHGALRHLDHTYIEHEGKDVRAGALMFDFAFLFVEGCILFSLAVLIKTPQFFAWGLVILFAFDIVWAFFAYLGLSPDGESNAEIKWTAINIIAAAILIVVFTSFIKIYPPSPTNVEINLGLCILTIAFARTAIDYGSNWDFYYPTSK